MPRRRMLTEMIGCTLTKPHYDLFKAEMKRRKTTAAEYLRIVAVQPLIDEITQGQTEGLQDGPQ